MWQTLVTWANGLLTRYKMGFQLDLLIVPNYPSPPYVGGDSGGGYYGPPPPDPILPYFPFYYRKPPHQTDQSSSSSVSVGSTVKIVTVASVLALLLGKV